MGGTCADHDQHMMTSMMTKVIKTKLFETTCRGWYDYNHSDGDLRTHSQGEEGLSETVRLRIIPVMEFV